MFLTRIKQSNFYKTNKKFLQDGAKQTITFSYVLANIVNLWPLNASSSKNVTFWLVISSFFLQEITFIVYIFTSVSDIDDLLKSVEFIGIGIQVSTYLSFYLTQR